MRDTSQANPSYLDGFRLGPRLVQTGHPMVVGQGAVLTLPTCAAWKGKEGEGQVMQRCKTNGLTVVSDGFRVDGSNLKRFSIWRST